MHPLVRCLRRLPSILHQCRFDRLLSRPLLRLSGRRPAPRLDGLFSFHRIGHGRSGSLDVESLPFLERSRRRCRAAGLTARSVFWDRVSRSRCGAVRSADRGSGSGFLRARGTDVRRARSGFGPRVRCLSKPGTRIHAQHRRKPRRSRRIFRRLGRSGAALGLVLDRVCRDRLSIASNRLARLGEGIGADCRCRGSRNADRRIWPEPRNPLVTLLQGRLRYGLRLHRGEQDLSSNYGPIRVGRRSLFPHPFAAATQRRRPLSQCTGDRSGFGQ